MRFARNAFYLVCVVKTSACFTATFTPNTPFHTYDDRGSLSRSTATKRNHITLPAVAAVVNGETTSTDSSDASVQGITNFKLTACEKARTVTSVCTSGTLCTISGADGIQGSPFGSFVDYVLDDEGNPVFLMNEMSMHTINIRENTLREGSSGGQSMVSLFTQIAGQGQDVSRCSVTGAIKKIPADAEDLATIKTRYSIKHSYADQVMDSPKFAFYRMLPKKIYYVGGFGVMTQWVPVEEYRDAQADVLAREAADIVNKLNRDHREDLELTATHLLDIDDLEKVRVTGVDRLGIDVRVTKRISRRKLITDEFRIGFRIPVISVEDAKSEVLKIFQDAWEKGQGYVWDEGGALPGSDVPVVRIAEDSLA